MDSYGMGLQRMIVPPRDVSYSGPIFPEQTVLVSPDLSDLSLTEEQRSLIQTRLKTAAEAKRVEVERTQARWAARYSALYGTLESVCIGVKEDVTHLFDCARTQDLDEKHQIQTRPHFIKSSSQIVAASLARATARANGLQRGAALPEPLVKLETKVKR